MEREELRTPASVWGTTFIPDSIAVVRLRWGFLLIAALVWTGSAAKASSLLVNGSFEQGPPVGSFLNLPGGSTSITGWVVTGEGIDYVGSLFPASDGTHCIDLDGSSRSAKTPPFAEGGIAQTFATTPGTRYQVTFDMAGNPLRGPILKPMRVSAAGQEMDFTFDITGKSGYNMGWVSKSWTFTANSASTTIEFRSLTASPTTGWGAVIDNVSVTAPDGAPQPVVTKNAGAAQALVTKNEKEIQTNQKTSPFLLAHGANPPYLSEMPSVDRVKSEIQGSNPTDTLARQVAVFTYLPQIVTRLQDPGRSVRSPLMPDEQRVISAYDLAAYQLSQSFSKSHTPEEAKAFEKLHGQYEMNPKFYDQWFNGLFSPEFRAAYERVVSGKLANYQAHVDQERRDFEKDKAQQAAAAKGQSPFVRNDPGTLAARRCVELGGSELECIGKGLTTGFFDLAGLNPNLAEGSPQAGLRMSGVYKGAFSLMFDQDSASLDGCGKLVAEGHRYAVKKEGSRLLIEVQNEPKAFVLALGPDGRLAGPGPIDIKGKIIVGYRTYWVEQRRVSDNTIIPGSGHEVKEPIYEPKTERCTAGVLLPAGATSTSEGVLESLSSLFSGQSADQGAHDSQKDTQTLGLRMGGRYSGQGGLSLEFHAAAAVIDCGEAHVARPYMVENAASQVLVTVKNGAAPFTLAVRPDGTLTGSGSAEVAGRVVAGSSANGIAFAPRNSRCTIGTLAPSGAPAQR